MGAVAKRFFRRGTATAKRHSFFHGKLVSVGVDQFHFALHDVRTVLDCLDCYHVSTVTRATNESSAANPEFWGAHAPRMLAMAPSPARTLMVAKDCFGEAPKPTREGACAPQSCACTVSRTVQNRRRMRLGIFAVAFFFALTALA